MYEYKTELLYVKKKWTFIFNKNCIGELDKIINERSKYGWELINYAYIDNANSMGTKAAFTITFRKNIN